MFDAVAHLLNLEVDLIFFDTTSTYFETEQPDEPVWRDQHGRVLPEQPDADSGTDGRPDGGRTAADGRRCVGRGGAGGVPHARQVQGLPRRPARRSWSGWP